MRKTQAMASGITTGLLLLLYVIPGTVVAQQSTEPQVVIGMGLLGVDLSRVTVLAGAFGVGIGFGMQRVVNNFVSGLILLFERPVHVGDAVELGALQGVIALLERVARAHPQVLPALPPRPSSWAMATARSTSRCSPGRTTLITGGRSRAI
jgi:hypothetical protein